MKYLRAYYPKMEEHTSVLHATKIVIKRFISCKSVINKLGIVSFPKEFDSVNKLERILVSKKILFKEITIMPKGQILKIKGTTFNIPVQKIETNCSILPRPPNSNGIVIVKLTRKIEYKGHVSSTKIGAKITYLKNNNQLYKNIWVDFNNIAWEFKSLKPKAEILKPKLINNIHQPIKIILGENAGNIDGPKEPKMRYASNEIVLIAEPPAVADMEEAVAVAPGEGKPSIFLIKWYVLRRAVPSTSVSYWAIWL